MVQKKKNVEKTGGYAFSNAIKNEAAGWVGAGGSLEV